MKVKQGTHARRLRDAASCLEGRVTIVDLRHRADAVVLDGLLEAIIQVFQIR